MFYIFSPDVKIHPTSSLLLVKQSSTELHLWPFPFFFFKEIILIFKIIKFRICRQEEKWKTLFIVFCLNQIKSWGFYCSFTHPCYCLLLTIIFLFLLLHLYSVLIILKEQLVPLFPLLNNHLKILCGCFACIYLCTTFVPSACIWQKRA